MEIVNYNTKQKGYGRQSVYIDIQVNNLLFKDVYVEDVFPNLYEGKSFLLEQDAFYDEENNVFLDSNGNAYSGEVVFKTTLDAVRYFYNDKLYDNTIDLEYFIVCFHNDNNEIVYLKNNGKGTDVLENACLYKEIEEAEEYISYQDDDIKSSLFVKHFNL